MPSVPSVTLKEVLSGNSFINCEGFKGSLTQHVNLLLFILFIIGGGVLFFSVTQGDAFFTNKTACLSRPVVEVSMPMDSEVNLKLQNVMMLLRKCCNHPYLIEYPLDPATQQFKVCILKGLEEELF